MSTSNAFVRYLSVITGLHDLITDHTLSGGGLHETRAWTGRFAVHRDFNYHHKTMLANALVFITYLNRDWRPEYGGALELWDGKRDKKVTEVAPVFGSVDPLSLFRAELSRTSHPANAPTRSNPPFARCVLLRKIISESTAQLSWEALRFFLTIGAPAQAVKLAAGTAQPCRAARMGIRDRLKYLARGLIPPLLLGGPPGL